MNEVGPHTAALGFTRAGIEASKRKGDRIERRRRRLDAARAREASRHQEDVLTGLRALWHLVGAEDRAALVRIAERVREGAL